MKKLFLLFGFIFFLASFFANVGSTYETISADVWDEQKYCLDKDGSVYATYKTCSKYGDKKVTEKDYIEYRKFKISKLTDQQICELTNFKLRSGGDEIYFLELEKRGIKCKREEKTIFDDLPIPEPGQYPTVSTSQVPYIIQEHDKAFLEGKKNFIWDGIIYKVGEKLIDPNNNNQNNFNNDNENQVVETPNVEVPNIFSVASGTGFFITKLGHIITNNHVIDYCNEVKVHYKGDIKLTKLISRDLINDLALLKSEIKPEDYFAISKDEISLLEEIYVAGFPFGKEISSSIKVTKGVVSSLSGVGDNFSVMQIDAALQPGNSGGPIVDKKGNVVGVATAKLDFEKVLKNFGTIPEGTNFGIKSSVLNTFVKANNVKTRKPNFDDKNNKTIGNIITNATIYLDCWMTTSRYEKAISKKVLFSKP